MTFLIVICTILLVVDCLLLSLLVLVQLPKKDAGVGMAFGGGAADALFGAGSGTALSKLTKYTAIGFFALVFLLSVLNTHARRANISNLKEQFDKQPAASAPAATTVPAPVKAAPTGSNAAAIPLSITTNTTLTPATNPPAAK